MEVKKSYSFTPYPKRVFSESIGSHLQRNTDFWNGCVRKVSESKKFIETQTATKRRIHLLLVRVDINQSKEAIFLAFKG